jgi:hypothetical protein
MRLQASLYFPAFDSLTTDELQNAPKPILYESDVNAMYGLIGTASGVVIQRRMPVSNSIIRFANCASHSALVNFMPAWMFFVSP